MLHEFISAYRDEIISRCSAKAAIRAAPPETEVTRDHGVPAFLDQLMDALRRGLVTSPQISSTAVRNGHDLLHQGYTVSEVVHGYGDVCQSITGLALESTNGHKVTTSTRDDLREYIEYIKEFVATVQDARRAGKPPAQMANEWKTPARFAGYDVPPASRVRNSAELIYAELR